MSKALLEVDGLQKSFGGVLALKNVNFHLEPGSVHALCGGNGAGKSTFLTIIMGIQERDKGIIKIRGEEVRFSSPSDALNSGVSIIEQELSPVPFMSVSENIFLGREPLKRFRVIDFEKMNSAAKTLLDELGFDISSKEIMMNLTVAQLQLIEIAKAISYDADIIIMDEPTSALGEQEANQLFQAIKELKNRGKGIIYVSHRLTEIFSIADTYTVFRDGEFIDTGAISDITRAKLIHKIVGCPLTEEFFKENVPTTNVAIQVNLKKDDEDVQEFSFKAYHGEILALYGLMGSGCTEILESIFGLTTKDLCLTKINGTIVNITSPEKAIDNGLALVTEDRKESGLVMTGNVRSNICLSSLKSLMTGPIMSIIKEKYAAKKTINLFNIKTTTDKMFVSGLSGGNQQKVILGKWFLTKPKILLLDEPTRGVDVGAKREIYRIMSQFVSRGGTVVMASSEIDEVLGMADRIVIIRDGRISGTLNRSEATADKLMHLAA